jgi:hypothetical protein
MGREGKANVGYPVAADYLQRSTLSLGNER